MSWKALGQCCSNNLCCQRLNGSNNCVQRQVCCNIIAMVSYTSLHVCSISVYVHRDAQRVHRERAAQIASWAALNCLEEGLDEQNCPS